MAVPSSRSDREKDKFVDSGGETCVRLFGVSATLPGGTYPTSRADLEHKKFVEDGSGNVAVLFS